MPHFKAKWKTTHIYKRRVEKDTFASLVDIPLSVYERCGRVQEKSWREEGWLPEAEFMYFHDLRVTGEAMVVA